jgi:hypothetical protein
MLEKCEWQSRIGNPETQATLNTEQRYKQSKNTTWKTKKMNNMIPTIKNQGLYPDVHEW